MKGSKKQSSKAGSIKAEAAPVSAKQKSKVSNEVVEAPAGDGALSGDEDSGHTVTTGCSTSRLAALPETAPQEPGYGEWEGDPSQRSDGAVGSQSPPCHNPCPMWSAGFFDPTWTSWMGNPSSGYTSWSWHPPCNEAWYGQQSSAHQLQ